LGPESRPKFDYLSVLSLMKFPRCDEQEEQEIRESRSECTKAIDNSRAKPLTSLLKRQREEKCHEGERADD
jgi:hypothetical protein